MITLDVSLGERSYPIYIGRGLLVQHELLQQHIQTNEVMVVSNTTIAPLYLEKVKASLQGKRVEVAILPDGEQYKTLTELNIIFTALLEKRMSRHTTIIALGGGVVGDMAGFSAACYQRGIPFIQIPTTLLAQVDSSVGGKTAVNHELGKNMIGAFYQPRCVIADTDTLDTLDDRQLSAGIAEVIKYGLIRDPEFLGWLDENITALLTRDKDALAFAIERSCQNKADLVAADELEQGQRALLNLGHTFGHAIETGMGYGEWLHGEAVAAGMYMATDLSCRMGWIGKNEVDHLAHLLVQAKLPIKGPAALSIEEMKSHMAVDKKVVNGQLRLVLLKAVGKAIVTNAFDPEAFDQTLVECRE